MLLGGICRDSRPCDPARESPSASSADSSPQPVRAAHRRPTLADYVDSRDELNKSVNLPLQLIAERSTPLSGAESSEIGAETAAQQKDTGVDTASTDEKRSPLGGVQTDVSDSTTTTSIP